MFKKILIVGGNGSIGKSLTKDLVKEKGFKIFVIGRENITTKSHTHIKGDLNDKDFLKEFFNKYKFDNVLYLAGKWEGMKSSRNNFDENLLPLKNFIELGSSSIKKLIYFSSSAVYGDSNAYPEIPLSINPESNYGQAKLESENIIIDASIKNNFIYTILRPFHIVSKYENFNFGRSHVVTDFVHKAIHSKDEFLLLKDSLSDAFIPFTWANDLTSICKKIFDDTYEKSDIFNIGSNKLFSLKHLYFEILKFYGEDNIYNSKSVLTDRFDKSFEVFGNYNKTKFQDFIIEFIEYKNKSYVE